MKYRVRVDMSFESEQDARVLMDYAGSLADRAVSINEGLEREEISFVGLERCRHEEGLPCEPMERVEVRADLVVSADPAGSAGTVPGGGDPA